MGFLAWAILAAVCGAAVTVQAMMNSALQTRVGVPMTLLVNAAAGIAISAAVLLVARVAGGEPAQPLRGIPWPLLLGGVIGTGIVATTMLFFPKLGAAWALQLMVLGQLAVGLLADHLGWFGFPRAPITLTRLAGTALVLIGCYLARR